MLQGSGVGLPPRTERGDLRLSPRTGGEARGLPAAFLSGGGSGQRKQSSPPLAAHGFPGPGAGTRNIQLKSQLVNLFFFFVRTLNSELAHDQGSMTQRDSSSKEQTPNEPSKVTSLMAVRASWPLPFISWPCSPREMQKESRHKKGNLTGSSLPAPSNSTSQARRGLAARACKPRNISDLTEHVIPRSRRQRKRS